jgi:transcriptional regulator with XRE-family HTH domain
VERLAELRESQALTLRDLAERSGVDANTINQVELGHRKPRPSTLRKLAKALDVEVREFFEAPVPLGEAPRETGPTEALWPPDFEEWLKEHGAARILMTDEEVIKNFERIAFGSNKQAIPERFEQEARKTFEEEASVEKALTTEWVHGGNLLPQPEGGPGVVQQYFARHKEYSRLQREVLRSYSRYYRALEAVNESLFHEGRANDFVILNKRPQTVEAIREATRALQDEAFENERGA